MSVVMGQRYAKEIAAEKFLWEQFYAALDQAYRCMVKLGGGPGGYPTASLIGEIELRYPPSAPYFARPEKKTIRSGLRWEVFKRDGFHCKTCGTQDHLRADHIVPESAGGSTTLENLQTLCRSCNSRKGRKIPEGD